MKSENTYQVKLWLALAAILLCGLFLIAELFAWYIAGGLTTGEDIDMGVVDVSGDSDELVAGFDGVGGKAAELLPGAYIAAKLTISNAEDTDKEYTLKIVDATVEFPFTAEGFRYQDRYIDVYAYYKDGELYDHTLDPLYLSDKQAFFRSFAAPLSDAFSYRASVIKQNIFDESFTPVGYITAAGQVGDVTDRVKYQLNTPLEISSIGLEENGGKDSEGNQVTIKDGKITVAAKGKAIVYLLLYFDPDKFTVAGGIELRNSNPFLGQKLWISIGF